VRCWRGSTTVDPGSLWPALASFPLVLAQARARRGGRRDRPEPVVGDAHFVAALALIADVVVMAAWAIVPAVRGPAGVGSRSSR
jgi:hypothetical protein